MNQILLYFLCKRETSIAMFVLLAHGVFNIASDGLSAFVMEGDSVKLNTDVKTAQHEDIKWYFNDIRIAQITGDLSYICTDVQCNNGTEGFRKRLQLDHQTGSLAITNIRTTDSGLYELKIISNRNSSEQTFNVTVHDVSSAEQDEMKRMLVKEGESVTLDPGVMKNPNTLMWYFNDICIAKIKKEPRKISDVQCKDDDETFRYRLKLDHQTGSLTIINTTITDSGVYHLQINSNRYSVIRNFSVTVTAVSNSGLFSAAVAGIFAAVVIGVLLLMALSYHKETRMQHSNKANGVYDLSPTQSDVPLVDDVHEMPSNHTNALITNTTNESFPNHIVTEPVAVSEV